MQKLALNCHLESFVAILYELFPVFEMEEGISRYKVLLAGLFHLDSELQYFLVLSFGIELINSFAQLSILGIKQ